ncbi:MAG: hypothetical protein ACRETL_02860, partial [Gammaproteobacteria bacterium]
MRIKARNGGIKLSRVQVHYSDGSVHNEDRSISLLEGERTRAINAGRDERFVDQINLTIAPSKGGGHVKIEVYGDESDDGAKAQRPAAKTAKSSEPALIPAQPTKDKPTTAPAGTVTEFG